MKPRHVDALLIGGGVAAARCARTLRRRGFTGSVLLVGDEELPPYNRPPLSKELLREEAPENLILAEPAAWYAKRGVELALGTPATSLDPGERLVELADGTRLRFGVCLLATGAAPRPLPVPGGEHAVLLRTLADARRLRAAAVSGARAVVVGGGFIGVEVGASLAARGCSVTILERGLDLWAGRLGSTVRDWAVERLAAAGVEVRFRAPVRRLEPDAAHLRDERLSADLLAAGVGVEPRVALASAAGLEVADGIVVDERKATSAPAIFAAGDVSRPRGGIRIEHWHAAREAGQAAALAMLGEPVPPRRAPWIFSEFAGTHLDVVGEAPAWDELLALPGLCAYLLDGQVVQLAILDGSVPVEAARAFVERAPLAPELTELTVLGRAAAPTDDPRA